MPKGRPSKLSDEEKSKNYKESIDKHHQSESYKEYQRRYRIKKFKEKVIDSLEKKGNLDPKLKRKIEFQNSIIEIRYVLKRKLTEEEYNNILK